MKISFLDKNGIEDKLILIFPGWSCNRELYDRFHSKGWDIAVVEEYENADIDQALLECYSTIYLFAWSLGVFMASITDFKGKLTAAFALNGTEMPADDKDGIPNEIFSKTAENLSPGNLLKFRKRMAGSALIFREVFNREFNVEETDLLKKQLLSILRWQEEKPRFSLPWKKVFLSENDAIFPFANLKRFWERKRDENNIDIISLPGAHYVPLDHIVRLSIPDTEKVSERFSEAKDSYDRQAIAQRKLASQLSHLLKESGMKKGLSILEIGSGTGLFTKELVSNFSPRELDLVDISEARPQISGLSFTFRQADAEEWIAQADRKYDAIVSSATVQWFINLPHFICNVAERLNDNGILGFSTFLPGNLEELDSLRPSPLHYHTEFEIEEWMKQHFDNIKIVKSTFQLDFDSPVELLRHLRETGVAGSAPSGRLLLSGIRGIKKLTYRCACFTGVKKQREKA
ncbi:MAG: DUF452 family protein [Muribaculaceae bacterium]|nr:DUF452 family protein [Muribaculaceae bacterium]